MHSIKGELIDVRKLWDYAEHNALTDLIRFRNRWFCAFREGEASIGAICNPYIGNECWHNFTIQMTGISVTITGGRNEEMSNRYYYFYYGAYKTDP